jgi:hypothetical protein
LEPPKQPASELAKLFLEQPEHPTVRQQKCFDAIRAALEEYDCQLAVTIHFVNGNANPQINVVPSPRPDQKPKVA